MTSFCELALLSDVYDHPVVVMAGGHRPPGAPRHPVEAVTLVLLGLLALGIGSLWAADFRAVASRLYHRQVRGRQGMPPRLRRVTPPPTHPSVQRGLGAVLAMVGCVFVVGGVCALMP
ncbi:hypothetical protein [Streptomyces sp. LN785]|uniref:hypothetical protein n=1 Tax=Streptomyces sp. LN785 TaxID=3112983 RepID=UPI0037235576